MRVRRRRRRPSQEIGYCTAAVGVCVCGSEGGEIISILISRPLNEWLGGRESEGGLRCSAVQCSRVAWACRVRDWMARGCRMPDERRTGFLSACWMEEGRGEAALRGDGRCGLGGSGANARPRWREVVKRGWKRGVGLFERGVEDWDLVGFGFGACLDKGVALCL
ncbi:uncharacterized protein LY89DRAFT_469696 [Mollisia scopiformis]|uniref:Uncharacterized protein n=1 Tax=Mollisia scopiformis TaxID=149040 RepID=A0A194XIT6_MOLSC|nr:uncharacterized protein LY89DRAFT_469696 [Mollisia scopiformis]KUJ20046.1 hypothetical protein LY89DRAFT_469696 [Mollisia scopiformis]